MECNTIAYYKLTDKYGRMVVGLSKADREKFQKIEGTFMSYYLENKIPYTSPLDFNLKIKVPDKSVIYISDDMKLELDDRVKLRLRLCKYNYQGNIGYNYKLLSCQIV